MSVCRMCRMWGVCRVGRHGRLVSYPTSAAFPTVPSCTGRRRENISTGRYSPLRWTWPAYRHPAAPGPSTPGCRHPRERRLPL
ncbi:hypothetical protein SXIM_12910 [Streptomyces xiamenensis]|uniref:Uncharacterized protein n=1 Tax=Streptomyces xiamenensis TaxID=408015 RepID=A0A0F7FSV9_9ACTN|nr:hypothetical protein SXIM_12910 [Streptomyces xiamenensis]